MSLTRTLLAGTALAVVALTLTAGPGEAAPGPAPRDSGAHRAGTSLQLTNRAASVSTRVQAFVRSHGTKYTFGTYADPASGKVVLETDAPPSVVSALITPGDTTVRRLRTVDPATWGGAGITNGTAARCSTGYTVKNRAGTKYMITAGHCFANGQTVVTAPAGTFVGWVKDNGLPTHDMALLHGGTYEPSIAGAHVASAGDPVVGFGDYCHRGGTTGANCGHTVTSVTATLCTATGCRAPVIAFTGGTLPQPGDSGAPFYVGSQGNAPDKHVRGHIIAGNGSTGYAEKYSRVAARYGVTIAS